MASTARGERDLWLRILRVFDGSVYRCVWCGALARGIAMRCWPGWTCSADCYIQQSHAIDYIQLEGARRSYR